MQDLVGFRFGCSDCTRSHSMNDVEGGKQKFAAYAKYQAVNLKPTIRNLILTPLKISVSFHFLLPTMRSPHFI
jgi:hypothetical protein